MADTPERDDADDAEWSEHFVGAMGLELWEDHGETHARAALRPQLWAPGTEITRLGVFATMADVVGGSPPTGSLNPTVDLRVTLLRLPPADGDVQLTARTVKAGRRLYVGEVLLHTGDEDEPFAHSIVTFISNRIGDPFTRFGPRPDRAPGGPTVDEWLRPRFPAPGVAVMEAHAAISNGIAGTIQGGAQALLAELAGEHALAEHGRHHAVDLDIRYVNRARAGRVAAVAEVLPVDAGDRRVRVALRDGGTEGLVVSLVALAYRPTD